MRQDHRNSVFNNKSAAKCCRLSLVACRRSLLKGFGLMEVVVVAGIASFALTAFFEVGVVSLKLLRAQKASLEATLLAEEALEAVRLVRDASWTDIASRTDAGSPSLRYYPVVENGKWVLASESPGLVNGVYDRYVQFEKAYRDASDSIVSVGGSEDAGTRKVTAHVVSSAGDVVLTTYLTNFQTYVPVARINSGSGGQEYASSQSDEVAVGYDGATIDGDVASFPAPNSGQGDAAQTFTTHGSAVYITRVSLLVRRATASVSDVYAELRLGGPTGLLLGTSQTVTSATISDTSSAWVDFRFSPAVRLNPSTIYAVRLRSSPPSTVPDSGSTASLHWYYGHSSSGPYSGGMARRFVGAYDNPNDAGQPLGQYDFGFRLYALP